MSNDKEIVERPEFVLEEHLRFLDAIRLSGAVNMFGASPYLQEVYDELTKTQARKVLTYWMRTFSERHNEHE